MDARNYPPDETAFHQVKDAPTQADDEMNRSNTEYKDTQVIRSSSLKVQNSQPSKLKEIRMLSQNEENKIYDSSCEYRDTNIDTQDILGDISNKHVPDTIESSEKQTSQPDESEFGMKETQAIEDPNEKHLHLMKSSNQSEAKSQSQSGDILDLKPEGVTPWIRHVKDLFSESQTPWLDKIKNPFNETPITNKFQDASDRTPETILRKQQSLYTPVPSSHKIFEMLRDDQQRPELEIETQTQSAPNLMFNSLTQSPIPLRTQIVDLETNTDQDGTQIDVPYVRIHRLQDTLGDQSAETQQDESTETVPNHERTEVDEPFLVENNNQRVAETEPFKNPLDKVLEGTQDDIQVLGTAPDNVLTNHTQATDEIIDAAEKVQYDNDNFDDDALEMNDDPIGADSQNASSFVVSDDENNSNSTSADSKNNVQQASYILAEDSIPKHHRDFMKKFGPKSQKQSSRRDSNEDSVNILVHSQPLKNSKISDPLERNKADSIGRSVSFQPPIRPSTSFGFENRHTEAPGKTQRVETSDPSGHPVDSLSAEVVREVFSEIGANITQELSDIDDDSKVNNTIEEEDITAVKNKGSKEGNDEDLDMPTIRRRSKRNGVNVIRSPQPSKRLKTSKDLTKLSSSPLKPSQDIDASSSVLTTQLSPPRSEASFDDASNVIDQDKKKIPQDVLTEESRELNENDIIFKEYVWCQYNAHYYPGLIDSIGEKGFNVKFIDSIDDMSLVYPLDLRIGDHIIVNRSNYVVSGLESSSENDSNEIIRCMRGYDTVLVKRIKKGKAKKESNQEEKFPIGFIKMDTNEWFKKKRVGYDSFTKPRRNIQKEANHIIPTYQEELLMSTPQKMDNATKSNIFACCLFVITGDVQKDELSHLIYSHGGSIIEEGFSSTVYLENSENNEPIVRSKKLLQGFKFAALISNKHARSPKYLETLALGWPLLSTSFIHDSISEGTLKTEFLTTYLLPAGESKRMKFIKSHNIHGFKNNLDLQVDLSKQLSNNRLLNGKHVILTSTNPEIIRFIFYILGAKTVTITTLTNYTNLIHSLSTIAKEDIGDSSVLIYHEKMKTLKSGLESLDSPEKPKSSKKSQLITSDILSNRAPVTLELVDWEWVVQCLIDGSPWPSQTKTI